MRVGPVRFTWITTALLFVGCRDDGDEPMQGGSTSDDPTMPADTSGGSGGSGGVETGSTEGGATGDTDLPSPYSDGTTGVDDMPSAGPEVVAAAIATGLDAYVHARPVEVLAAYQTIAVMEPECPEEQQIVGDEVVGVVAWYSEGCTTSTGVTFTGGARLEVALGVVEEGRTVDRGILSSEGGTARIETDDGRYFDLSGYFSYERGTSADATDGYFGLTGTLEADATTAGDNAMLSGALRPQGYIYAYSGEGYRGIGGDGSITGTALEGVVALSFAGLVVADQPCASEPAGEFAVRDDAGFWHDVVFDAAVLEGEEYEWTGECDGCGAYIAGGTPSGEACIEAGAMGALLEWEVFPW